MGKAKRTNVLMIISKEKRDRAELGASSAGLSQRDCVALSPEGKAHQQRHQAHVKHERANGKGKNFIVLFGAALD